MKPNLDLDNLKPKFNEDIKQAVRREWDSVEIVETGDPYCWSFNINGKKIKIDISISYSGSEHARPQARIVSDGVSNYYYMVNIRGEYNLETILRRIHKITGKEKALFLVNAINQTFMATAGLGDPPPDPGVSLQELLDAAHFVRDMKPEPTGDGTSRIYCYPDDRLVAAAYAAWNHTGDWIENIQPVCITPLTTIAFIKTGDILKEAKAEGENNASQFG